MKTILNKKICLKCKIERANKKHTCTYNKEIKNDYKSKCNCCDYCMKDCAMDI